MWVGPGGERVLFHKRKRKAQGSESHFARGNQERKDGEAAKSFTSDLLASAEL